MAVLEALGRAPALGPPHMIPTTQDGPIIVTGVPRSGSTWFARVLAMHPRLRVYTHATADNHVLYLLAPVAALNPFAEDHARVVGWAANLEFPWRRRLLRAYYRTSEPESKVVLATPTTGAFLPWLAACFSGARFIHVKRDPLDVIASFDRVLRRTAALGLGERYREKRRLGVAAGLRGALAHGFHRWRWLRLPHGGYLVTRPPGFQRALRLPRLEFLCWYYAALENQIEEALRRLPAEHKRLCLYENLVRNHGAEMRGLWEFMGIEPHQESLHDGQASIDFGGVGRYRREFSSAAREVAQTFLAKYRRELAAESAWRFPGPRKWAYGGPREGRLC